ncbi:alpha/beta fold hydrolase [Frankia sp. Cas3]|uniref:alpha/beta fold hydrolase n=1 Tax=Frankia sp. Cas3 TaxID=3073926 RepID=UPI002AD59545|nr:alpha/beta fold hydrolase [Frankia sp. Cas3]
MRALTPTFHSDRWVPPPDLVGGYRVAQLAAVLGVGDRSEFPARAAADPEWFYPAALDFLGAEWLRPWTSLCDESDGAPFGHWFVGGGTNVSWLACERWVDRLIGPAVIWEGDGGESRELSFAELASEVRRASTGFRELGVGRGDVVVMHLPMVPEAIVTMLAVARLGAIVAPAFSGYGPAPLAERLQLAEARVLVTADGMMRRGRPSMMLETALTAAETANVKTVVVVSRLGETLPPHPAIVRWKTVADAAEAGEVETFDAETPWLLAFTSGSTGRPKGALHTHGGLPYNLMLELALTADVGSGDRFSWPSDMGWLAGPMGALGPLTLGATAVLFEGVADHPEPDRIWRFVERHGITQYALSPTTARTLAAAGEQWVAPYDLPTLRVILSSGEPWTLPAWRWLHRHVGRGRVPIINWSGGTEVGGCIVASYPDVATSAGRFSGPALGMAIDVVDDEGRSVSGELGELVVTRSWPAMTRGLWRETDRYLDAYWSRLPGTWVQGDRALRYADGSIEIPGRSDDVLKIAGKRVGPAELESLATEVEGVTAAAAIGVDDPVKGQVAVLVVQSSCAPADEARLTAAVADRITTAFGKPMRPSAVLAVPDLPRTRSGKVHRRAVRAWVTGSDPGDLSSLDNPQAAVGVRVAALGREDYDEFAYVRGPDVAVRREDRHGPDGEVLSAVIWGEQRPALLLLHGGGQNAHTWDGVAPALKRPLVALDLPGHGRSSHRADRDYWPWRNADVVAGAVPQLTAEPVVVVGMSLGGLTGIRFAARRPDLVRALVVVDVTPSVHEVEMTSQERGGSSLISAEPSFASFAELVDSTVAATGRRRESVAVGARHNSYRRADGRWAWRYDRLRLPGDPPLDFSALWADLEAVRCPLMLVRGGDSFHVPDAHADQVRRCQPSARLEIVSGAGHSVQSAKPAELAALIEDFAFTGNIR